MAPSITICSVRSMGWKNSMKFPMYKKETTDEKYHDDPFRAVNFETDSEGDLICPNGRKFHFAYRKAVKGNQYGRQEEYYTCEDCSECPYAERCKKTEKNRTVRINAELSSNAPGSIRKSAEHPWSAAANEPLHTSGRNLRNHQI